MQDLFVILSLMIIAAAVLAVVARRLRQPLLLGYVAAGLLLGPAALGFVRDVSVITLISELGLIFLMFVIGLELDLTKLKDVGKASVLLGILQVGLTTIAGTLVARAIGFSWIEGLYLGFVIAFSSTIVVVKALNDKGDLTSLHGELVLGILVIQDILAALALTLLGTLEGAQTAIAFPSPETILAGIGVTLPAHLLVPVASLLIQGALFVLATFLFFRYVMPLALGDHVPQELLFVASLAVVFIISAFAAFFQFSFAIGAFAAGIALSSSSSSHEITGRVRPLKDFFLILFFVGMGLQLGFAGVLGLPLLVLLAAGALLIKPGATFLALKLLRYNNRTAFLVALHLAQLSEFGLVLLASGIAAGVLSPAILTAVVIVTVATMTLSVYAIKYDEALYRIVRPLIIPSDLVFGTRPEEVRNVPEKYRPDVVFVGIDPTVEDLIAQWRSKRRILVVDANPATAIRLREKGIPTVCSDAANVDLYVSVDLSKAQLVISVVREGEEFLLGTHGNLYLIRKVREVAPGAAIIVHASTESFGLRLYAAGATLVLTPTLANRRMLAALVTDATPARLRALGQAYREELTSIERGVSRATPDLPFAR